MVCGLGVNLSTFIRDWMTWSAYANYCRFTIEHDLKETYIYDHFMSIRIVLLIVTKIFIRAPNITRELLRDRLGFASQGLCISYPTKCGYKEQTILETHTHQPR